MSGGNTAPGVKRHRLELRKAQENNGTYTLEPTLTQ